VAQPIYDEMAGAAVLVYKMANGEKVPYWTILEAPLVTKANLDAYYTIFDKLEPQFRAAVNPDALKPTPVVAKGVTGPFYFVQSSAWHPVHQLMQQSFLDGCAKNGLKCQLATTDENTLDALVAMADATVQRPDAKGFVFYAGGLPVFKPIIEKAKARNLPVVLPHFPVPEGSFASNAVQIAADTTKYPDPVAKAMCDELTKQGITKGSVAITENGHNATEDMVAAVFAASMKKYCPNLKVLDVVLEGGEPATAIAAAVSIIQANPDIVAGFSTTGGGPTTWAGAQDQTGKKVLSVGMDYTRVNLDLVKAGKVWGIVAQPIYDEMAGAAVLVYKMANGEKVPYWTILEAPLVTKDNLDAYYAIFNKLEPQFRAAVNPDALRATATPAK
jgi:ribose transport system substrate-binding protein